MKIFMKNFKKTLFFLFLAHLNVSLVLGQDLNSYIQKSIELEKNGKPKEAIQILDQVLELLEKRDSTYRWFGLIHSNKAYVYLNKGDFESAIRSFKTSIDCYNQDSVVHLEIYLNIHFDLGMAYWNLFTINNQDSILLDSMDVYHSKAMDYKDFIHPPEHLHHVLFPQLIGEIASQRKKYKKSKGLYLKAFNHLEKIPSEQLKLKYTISEQLAETYNYLHQIDSAYYYYKINLKIAKKTFQEGTKEIAIAYYNLAVSNHWLNQFEPAFNLLDTALFLKPEIFPPYIRKELLIKAAFYNFQNNILGQAENYYLKSLEEGKLEYVEGQEMHGLALLFLFIVYYESAKFNDAKITIGKACKFFSNYFSQYTELTEEVCNFSGTLEKIPSDQKMIYDILKPIFNQEDSIVEKDIILKVLKKLDIDPSMIEYEPKSSNPRYDKKKINDNALKIFTFLGNKEYDSAIKQVQKGYSRLVPSFKEEDDLKADPDLEDFNLDPGQLSLHLVLKSTAVLLKLEDNPDLSNPEWDYAFTLFERADKAMQRIRRFGMQSPQTPMVENILVEFYSNWARLNLMRLQISKDFKYIEGAFNALERRKGINLLERIKLRSMQLNKPDYVSIKTKEQQLLNYINEVSNALELQYEQKGAFNFKQAILDSIENQYYLGYQKLSAFKADIRVKYPQYDQLSDVPELISTEGLSSLLDDQTVILNYYVKAENITVVSLQKDQYPKIQFEKSFPGLYNWIDVIKKIRDKRGMVNMAYREAATNLYEALIPELPNNIKNLIIVPDGKLHEIPFEALLTDQGYQIDSLKNLSFLVKDFNISYGISATYVAKHLKSRKDKEEDYPKKLIGFGPEQDTYLHEMGLEEIFDSTVLDQKVSLLTYAQATKTAFFNHSQQSTEIILVDAHGEKGTKIENYNITFFGNEKLFLPELMDHNLQNDLFILASCDMGSGEILAAEGILGFVRGILFAGAENVITSKNKLALNVSKLLLTEFYKEVFEAKNTYTGALGEARRHLLENEQYADPFYWGGLTLFGY